MACILFIFFYIYMSSHLDVKYSLCNFKNYYYNHFTALWILSGTAQVNHGMEMSLLENTIQYNLMMQKLDICS